MSLQYLNMLRELETRILKLEARVIERDNVIANIDKALAEVKARKPGRPPKDKNGLGTNQTND